MNIPRLVAVCFLCGAAANASARPLPSPAAIIKEIHFVGAKRTVERLTEASDGAQWELVLLKVESGDARWLAVADALADGTDAGDTEALRISVAMALRKNPGAVLAMADTKMPFALPEICGAPFIEPAPDFYRRYLRDARRALDRYKNVALDEKRRRCLATIEHLLSDEDARRR